jgi:RNA polymerase sigma-32 factor
MAYLPGVGSDLVKAAKEAPFLEREQEKELARAWRERNDSDALHTLTYAHMRLVIAMAVRVHRRYGLPIADLIQEGHVGLLQAVARFAPERDVRLSTYATWGIRNAMQDYVLSNWSIVRSGRSSSQKALFFNLRKRRAMRDVASRPSGGYDALQSIASEIGVSRADVELMNSRLSSYDLSLNSPLIDAETLTVGERMDFLVDDRPLPDQDTEDALDSPRNTHSLEEALKLLSERERLIVREHYLNEDVPTLGSIGDRLGISKERVRQIECRALLKLREAMTKDNSKLSILE